MWIKGTSQYAIRAVSYVAEHGAAVPVRVGPIAEALHVPRNYLSKTLHVLARAGLLRSERGPRGGFQLAVPADRLTLADVTAPFEDMRTQFCLLGRNDCGGEGACAAHRRWSDVSTALRQYFSTTTISDLLGDVNRRGVEVSFVPRAHSRTRRGTRTGAATKARPASQSRTGAGKKARVRGTTQHTHLQRN